MLIKKSSTGLIITCQKQIICGDKCLEIRKMLLAEYD